jgi:uncharacterized membrane protein (DUF485 family)
VSFVSKNVQLSKMSDLHPSLKHTHTHTKSSSSFVIFVHFLILLSYAKPLLGLPQNISSVYKFHGQINWATLLTVSEVIVKYNRRHVIRHDSQKEITGSG